MTIDLSNIASKADKTRIVNVETSGSIELENDNFTVKEISPFELKLENVNNKKLVIEGETGAHIISNCDRCLSEVEFDLDLEIAQAFEIKGDQVCAEEDDPVRFLNDNHLDTDMLLGDEILCNLPYKVLCKDDCRGLCLVCGKNLNLGECDCNRQSLDPRMQQFLDVFNENN